VTETDVRVPAQRTAVQRLAAVSTFWIALVLVVLCVLFSVLRPDAFPTLLTLQTLLIGSVLVFSGVVGATLMEALTGGDASGAGLGVVLLGLLGALAGGGAWGLLNGLLVARARIPPLIVTLGSFGAALGAAQLITDGVDVRTVPRILRDGLGFGQTAQVPHMVALAAVVTLAGAWLLHTTRFGRRTFAVGSNAEAARRAGIPVRGHLVRVYTGVGLLAGLAGFMSLAYFGTTTISGHSTDNLNAIAAVVLGGTSLFGGVGTVFGTVIGVFIPAVLSKGFVIVGVQQFWQPVAISAVLVAAVWFDQVRRRSRDSR
jgi:ribose transport system permease protein